NIIEPVGVGSACPVPGVTIVLTWASRTTIRPRCLRQRFIDCEDPTAHALAVESINCVPQFPFFVQHDESETSRLTRRPVPDDLRRFDLKALGLHPFLQLRVRGGMRYVSNKQFWHRFLSNDCLQKSISTVIAFKKSG